MRVKIAPAYLGLSASQSERSKTDPNRQVTKTIWMDKQGMRIPVSQMTDYHLCATIRKLRWWAKRTRDWLKRSMWWEIREWFKEHHVEYFHDGVHDEEGYEVLVADLIEAKRLAELSNENFCRKFIPTWDEMIEEGKKRGLLNERGYRTNKVPMVE